MDPSSVLSKTAVRTVLLSTLLLFSVSVVPLRALAALGEDRSSVESDRRQFRSAKLTARDAGGYTTHEFYSEHGTTVREFVSPEGKVFGVAWEGPHIPDLRQLLGSHYQEFENGAAQARSQQMRGPIMLAVPGLVVESGGHMRAYSGRAYIPALLPAGVSVEAIR